MVNAEWGDNNNSKKYFSGHIRPNSALSRIRTHTSKPMIAEKDFKFKRNMDTWKEFSVETIFYQTYEQTGLIGLLPKNSTSMQTPSLAEDDSLAKDDLFIPNIGQQIDNATLNLHKIISEVGKVQHFSIADFDLPSNKNAADLIYTNKYNNYNVDDFVRVSVYFNSYISHREEYVYSGENNPEFPSINASSSFVLKVEDGRFDDNFMMKIVVDDNVSKDLGWKKSFFEFPRRISDGKGSIGGMVASGSNGLSRVEQRDATMQLIDDQQRSYGVFNFSYFSSGE
jgi:hypothetical protein